MCTYFLPSNSGILLTNPVLEYYDCIKEQSVDTLLQQDFIDISDYERNRQNSLACSLAITNLSSCNLL